MAGTLLFYMKFLGHPSRSSPGAFDVRLLLITYTKNLKTVRRVASQRVVSRLCRRVDTFLHYVIQLRAGRIFHSEISSVRSAHLSQFPFQKGILHYVFQRSGGDATARLRADANDAVAFHSRAVTASASIVMTCRCLGNVTVKCR